MSDWPVSGDAERTALLDVLESGKWWRGPYAYGEGYVGRFERAWADYCGVKHCLCVPNGTQALELALTSVGVQPGDEVITPAITFAATATAVIRVGAVPVIVDVNGFDYQLDLGRVGSAKERPKVAALMPVHYGGGVANTQFYHPWPRIVDAAHAAGGSVRSYAPIWGSAACFSFQAGKPLTCGEGGAVITDDDDIAEAMWSQASAGPPEGAPYSMQRRAFGNFRLTEFQGAVLCTQMERFKEQMQTRLANAALLNDAVADIDGIDAMPWPTQGKRGFYLWHVKFRPDAWPFDRDEFRSRLRGKGVAAGTGHTLPLHLNPHFKGNRVLEGKWRAEPCPEAERIYREEAVSFSHTQFLEQAETERIAEAIKEIRQEA